MIDSGHYLLKQRQRMLQMIFCRFFSDDIILRYENFLASEIIRIKKQG